MKRNREEMLQTAQERRCDVRLENDASALEAVASKRMQVVVRRFGNRVMELNVLFPQVKTAFLHRASKEVEVHQAGVLAKIQPNAGNSFPYPLGSPEVRIYYPGLKDLLVPWLGGLFWLDDKPPDQEAVPEFVRGIIGAIWAKSEFRLGLPCLWREGEWTPECDLIFVARQVHRLLTDPRDYSPSDAMNAQAALYWAAHKEQLPLEPPIPEVYGETRRDAAQQAGRPQRFTLVEVE